MIWMPNCFWAGTVCEQDVVDNTIEPRPADSDQHWVIISVLRAALRICPGAAGPGWLRPSVRAAKNDNRLTSGERGWHT
eukprot:364639-Chlamydomonas_euryale.AAC.45